jgi:uncharacterized membrane protein
MSAPAALPAPSLRDYRISSLDMVRGLVMVIMALDHVREYFYVGGAGDPTADPNVSLLLFLTRWVTHFCAPVFVLLAGSGAGLMAARRSKAQMAGFLLTRGVWLILIEWFVMSTAFTFAPQGLAEEQGRVLVVLQVIWAIGAGMVVLAALQFAGHRTCLVLGAVIVLGHNLLDGIWPDGSFDGSSPWWVSLHALMGRPAGPFELLMVYPLLPWLGVLLLGYGFAPWLARPAAQRNRTLLWAGLALSTAFIVLRALDAYGDPRPWQAVAGQPLRTVMSFLATTKYPPSLAFLLMTLGPAAILCSFADRMGGALKSILITYGRVPFAFYVPHFYLIHALSVVVGVAQGFAVSQMLTFVQFYPHGYGLPLAGVYAVWLLVVALLYPWCRWVGAVKARRRDWWLSYV